MKNILKTIILFAFVACKAQTIIPMNNSRVDVSSGDYLMDTEYELNKYIGTWKYQNGNESLTIIIDKELHHQYGGFFSDILIGEYKYIDATGTTIVNTLSNNSQTFHNIRGAIFTNKLEFPKCLDCTDEEFRIKSYFSDPDRTYVYAAIMFRWISPTQIKAKIYADGMPMIPDDTSPTTTRVPYLEYTLNKI
jgi:hypothetical protein